MVQLCITDRRVCECGRSGVSAREQRRDVAEDNRCQRPLTDLVHVGTRTEPAIEIVRAALSLTVRVRLHQRETAITMSGKGDARLRKNHTQPAGGNAAAMHNSHSHHAAQSSPLVGDDEEDSSSEQSHLTGGVTALHPRGSAGSLSHWAHTPSSAATAVLHTPLGESIELTHPYQEKTTEQNQLPVRNNKASTPSDGHGREEQEEQKGQEADRRREIVSVAQIVDESESSPTVREEMPNMVLLVILCEFAIHSRVLRSASTASTALIGPTFAVPLCRV